MSRSKMNKCLIMVFVLSSFFSDANPISDISRKEAETDLKNSLQKLYYNSESTVRVLLEAGMLDYDVLCKLPDSPLNLETLQELKERYYPHFSTILVLYKVSQQKFEEDDALA